jgi:putative hydrolase of the HAD superfamily
VSTIRALLFDIGEVVSPDQWPLLDEVERRTGRTIVGRGPLDPGGDPVWQRYLRGELSFTGYWAEFAHANGYDDWRQLFRELPFETGSDDFVHPEAARLIRDAQRAGLRIGALTNDGVGINGVSFFRGIPLIASFDAFCDAQAHGGKPAPDAYRSAAAELGVAPDEVVFLDDTTWCVDGARAVGMWGVLVDPTDRRTAFDAARRIAGIGDVGEAQRLVDRIANAYRAGDPVEELLDPDVTVHLNGTRVALGAHDAAVWLTSAGVPDRLQLRAASGDTLTVELGDDLAEIWTLRRGLVVAIRRYGPDRVS